MTVQEFQNAFHLAYQGDTDTPASTDDEWDVRLGLLKAAINAWETDEGTMWEELWVQLEDSATGDKTVLSNTVDYDCPDDFKFPGGFVRITDTSGKHTYVKIVKPHKAELYLNASTQACYFTGNKKVGFQVHFLFQPTAGYTINYPYYKDAYIPTLAAHVLEMSDPYFAIEHSLAKQHEADGDGDRSTLAMAKAQAKLNSMKKVNQMPAWYQENAVPDRDYVLGVGGFGR